MKNYVNGDGSTGTVNLAQYDTGGGVYYFAGAGNQVINGSANAGAINLGSGNDTVHLSNADTYVSFGTGRSQVACGGGHDTFNFNAGAITKAGAALDNIVYFEGAGDNSGSDPSKDFINFNGFAAGSTLQFRGYTNPASQQGQTYNVVDPNGVVQGSFTVSMNKDADGTFHHLSAATDYSFDNAAQAAGDNFIGFDEFPLGAHIANQYAAKGLVFGGDNPFISADSANATAPVLADSNGGAITGKFVDPATGVAGTVNHLSLNADFLGAAGVSQLTLYDASGNVIGAQTESQTGVQSYSVNSATAIASFSVSSLGGNQLAIDSVSFGHVTKT